MFWSLVANYLQTRLRDLGETISDVDEDDDEETQTAKDNSVD